MDKKLFARLMESVKQADEIIRSEHALARGQGVHRGPGDERKGLRVSRGKKLPPRIERVRTLEGGKLAIRWVGGVQATVDLSRDLARYKSLAALRKAAEFRRATVGEGGHSVIWPSGVDIGADSLWRDSMIALGHADAVAFNDWRMAHGLTLDQAAEALGLSRRMVAYYSSGDKPVPKTVLLACRGWEAAKAA